MPKKTKTLFFFAFIILLVIAGAFYFRHQVYFSHGKNLEVAKFEIVKGEGNAEVAAKLESEGLISSKYYFYYYVRMNHLLNKIMPGEYDLSGSMTVPEIAKEITSDQEKFVKITFPEGWNSKEMAERLKANGLDGDGFLALVKSPDKFRDQYDFLNDSRVQSLEGYLFPDTYFFKSDITAEDIVIRMLDNFHDKVDGLMIRDIKNQGKSLEDIVIMASIVEAEVTSPSDRQIVSGIFWKRINQGMPLQSDATLTYAFGDEKNRHSYAETRLASPFNTYINKGLPPSPINNPGLDAIQATIIPKASDYLYFLSDPNSGQTYFARTLDEQNVNKNKVGL